MRGVLALVGGEEWREGCTFDAGLLEASGGDEVVVLPTAAAYERPARAVEAAAAWFGGLGARVRPLMVLRRSETASPEVVDAVRSARFVYLSGGSPLHLRSVLKDSPLWSALEGAWQDGAVVAGSSAGAMVLCDPMVDPRGGALTVGLGLIEQVAVVPHHEHWGGELARRTIDLAGAGIKVLAVDARTAAIRTPDGAWRTEGAGGATVLLDGREVGLDALP